MGAEINTTTTLEDQTPNSSIVGSPQEFTKIIDDLPLMAGLSLAPEDDVLFVTPHSGRIAETVAIGAVDIDDVYRFYRRTLPQLGWHILDGRTYQRENEQLRIDAHADGKKSTVRFSVKPMTQTQTH